MLMTTKKHKKIKEELEREIKFLEGEYKDIVKVLEKKENVWYKCKITNKEINKMKVTSIIGCFFDGNIFRKPISSNVITHNTFNMNNGYESILHIGVPVNDKKKVAKKKTKKKKNGKK